MKKADYIQKRLCMLSLEQDHLDSFYKMRTWELLSETNRISRLGRFANTTPKKVKAPTNATKKRKPPEFGSFVYQCLLTQKTNHPERIINTSDKAISSGSETIRLLIKKDGFAFEEIQKVIEWALDDEFWTTNIFSLAPLRKVSPNGLTKYVNIRNSYMKDNKREDVHSDFNKVTKKKTYNV